MTDINDNPLPGVNIVEKGTASGTVTDLDGNYSIVVSSANVVLEFSYVGFLTEEIAIAGQTTVNVTLVEDLFSLEEVVVIGYSQQKKITITGSVSSVKAKELEQISTPTLGDGIFGRVPGISMTTVSGTPGESDPTVFIRGIGTLNSAEPLFIVDGVPVTKRTFMQLNPSSIQDLSVLKDASATAVYGVRGANGVIIVQTKRGEIGKTQIDAQVSYGMQVPTQLLEFGNSYQWASAYNEQLTNDGKTDGLIPDDIIQHYKSMDQPYKYPSVNWIDEEGTVQGKRPCKRNF